MEAKFALYAFDGTNIDQIINQGIMRSGIADRIKTARSVFIKPNLVSDVEEYIEKGSNTDIRMIEAVVKYLSEFNIRILIGESETGSRMKGRKLERTLELMGVKQLQDKYGFEIVNCSHDKQVPVKIDNGLLIKEINLSEKSLAADLIINMPKLKTHKFALMTCAMKNMFGLIPDPYRVIYHKNIDKAVADINSVYAERTVVVLDAIKCMEGQGPLSGNMVEMNLIGFANSPLVNDIVASEIIGFNQGEIKYINYFNRMTKVVYGDINFTGPVKVNDIKRKFLRAKQNLYLRFENNLMKYKFVVKILWSDIFRRHFTYPLRSFFAYLRGDSFSWYINEEKKNKK